MNYIMFQKNIPTFEILLRCLFSKQKAWNINIIIKYITPCNWVCIIVFFFFLNDFNNVKMEKVATSVQSEWINMTEKRVEFRQSRAGTRVKRIAFASTAIIDSIYFIFSSLNFFHSMIYTFLYKYFLKIKFN